jgi:hypothetical protein
MGNWLDEYPELMIKEEVAEILRIKPVTVPRLKGLKKTKIGGRYRYQKVHVKEYMDSNVERREVIKSADKQKERYWKMGVSSLLPWEELQKARLENTGGGA